MPKNFSFSFNLLLPNRLLISTHWKHFSYATALLLGLGLTSQPVCAQDSTFIRLLRKNQYSLTQNGLQFAGSGWEKLLQDVRKSQVVLVGEDHGTAQIPAFTAALAREFKPATFVAEIDPYQAQDLARLADRPGLPVAFQQQHPMGLSFYSWAEEFELAQALRSQKVHLVGIDQVNCFATGRFYERVADLTTHKTTQAWLRRRAAAYQARDRRAFDAGLDQLSMLQQSPAALDSLVSRTQPESPAVRQMVQQYRTSVGIYQAQVHRERVNLMRRNLLLALRPVASPPGPPLPKLLIKMGAFHIARGATLIDGVFDVGNLALSLAEAQDQKSLHILVAGKQGTKLAGFSLADVRKNVVTYSNAAEAFVQPFPVPAGSTAWQVFDLRPLRRALVNDKLKTPTNDLSIILMGYDYVVIIPETTASRNF